MTFTAANSLPLLPRPRLYAIPIYRSPVASNKRCRRLRSSRPYPGSTPLSAKVLLKSYSHGRRAGKTPPAGWFHDGNILTAQDPALFPKRHSIQGRSPSDFQASFWSFGRTWGSSSGIGEKRGGKNRVPGRQLQPPPPSSSTCRSPVFAAHQSHCPHFAQTASLAPAVLLYPSLWPSSLPGPCVFSHPGRLIASLNYKQVTPQCQAH